MAKLRMEITKGEEIRFISHLDYARTIERAVRRAQLPAAYSEGFNPHMKLAFASALGLGVASQAEYMDIELKQEVEAEDVMKSLSDKLPASIKLKRAKYVPPSSAALMAIVNLAEYRIEVAVTAGADEKVIAASIERFNQAGQVQFVRQSPKGRREINVKEFVRKVDAKLVNKNQLEIEFDCIITQKGTIKPSEVIEAMADVFELPINKSTALINRNGLYVVRTGEIRLSPLEVFE